MTNAQIKQDLTHWFFDIYLNHWVEVGNGIRNEGHEFILKYWGTPMFVTADEPDMATWLNTDEEVIGFLKMNHDILQASGYTHTVIPDKEVTVYNKNGGSVKAILSRRAADEREIHRIAVHYQIARMKGVWKVVGIQGKATTVEQDDNSLAGVWGC